MHYDSHFQKPKEVPELLAKLRVLSERTGPLRLMEICGTHTMVIAKTGLRSLLPPSITLISGPGCPVCVTPAGEMDAVLALSEQREILLTTYGDLLRVPGSVRGDSLLRRKALGASVEAVYSPMDALELAKTHPERQVVFVGVGFETTAPGTAACILEAARENVSNFSVFCLLKRTEPALRTLVEAPDVAVDGFLCPGHVAAVTGADSFSFLAKEYGLPAVISGFEAADLLYSVLELTRMAAGGEAELKNEYVRLVKPEGNPAAVAMMNTVFEPCTCRWRGLGEVRDGGMAIRDAYASFDAGKRFGITAKEAEDTPGCSCAQIIRGVKRPQDCPLFGGVCTPADPVGPCMVSGEGACAAAWKYRSMETMDKGQVPGEKEGTEKQNGW